MMEYIRDKKRNGFSLVELIMVMVILGILASVAIPKMSNVIDKAELRTEQTIVNQIWAGLEEYSSNSILENGNDAWPYHPLTVFGRTRNIIITLDLGVPNEDNEWQFDGFNIYHRRRNNEVWYFTYDRDTFYLSEQPVQL